MIIDPTLALPLATAHAPFALALSYHDVREHRLPNKLVLAISGSTTAVAGTLAILDPTLQPALFSAVALSLLGTLTAIVGALLVPDALGMGDAKVIYSTLMPTLFLGAPVFIGALVWICIIGALLALTVLVLTRGDIKARFAFGPVLVSAPYGGVAIAALGVV